MITNYQRLQQMTVEELANFLDEVTLACSDHYCKECPVNQFNNNAGMCNCQSFKDWLEEEYIG